MRKNIAPLKTKIGLYAKLNHGIDSYIFFTRKYLENAILYPSFIRILGKMANKIERGNMNSPCFDEILPGDLHFLLPFQIANNVID